jgi:hypothetical protein
MTMFKDHPRKDIAESGQLAARMRFSRGNGGPLSLWIHRGRENAAENRLTCIWPLGQTEHGKVVRAENPRIGEAPYCPTARAQEV